MTKSLYIHNAQIWTGTGVNAKSLLLHNGRVAALDAPPPTRPEHTIDARGATVTPGLIDAHVHLLMAGKSLAQLDLRNVRSRAEFEAAIAARHAELPAGQWLLAHGWSSENWHDTEDRIDKTWLDAAGTRPVVAYRMDLHVALVNETVLELCDCSTDPPGGHIDRDADGQPTGVMIEAAAWQLINPLVPELDVTARQQCLLAAQQHAHALGITSVGSMEYLHDVHDVFLPRRNELTLRCRITLLDRDWPMDFRIGREIKACDFLSVIGFKTFLDGTLGSRTARLLADYSDDPGNRGMFVELAARGHLRDWAHAVAEAGYSPSMHAIGDEAVRAALDVIEDIDPACRPRIEHAQQIDLADISRFTGVIASMQPLHRADDGRYARARLGDERLAGTFAFRSLQDTGAILAFGSDWPVVTCDPIAGIRAAVTGRTLDNKPFQTHENLTVEESLLAYTVGAAHTLQLDEAGTLTPGKLGDVVLFDGDPFTADWATAPPRITCTIVNGEVVFERPKTAVT